jgi:hypothetical protein
VFYVDPTRQINGALQIRRYPDDAFRNWNVPRWSASWNVPDMDPDFEFIFSLPAPFTLVLEEFSVYVKAGQIWEPWLKRLLTEGRNYGIDIVIVSQFPSQVGPIVRILAHRVYALAMTEPKARQYLESWLEIDVPTENYQYVYWSCGDVKQPGNGPAPRPSLWARFLAWWRKPANSAAPNPEPPPT